MSFFQKHMFICCNEREGNICCNQHGASAMLDYAKDKAKSLGLDKNGVRINKSGCLGRCDQGPVAVVYPEGTWYTFIDQSDIDDIVVEHLQNGRPVERLKI
jgi:(2Fe-2S) ferredoxin